MRSTLKAVILFLSALFLFSCTSIRHDEMKTAAPQETTVTERTVISRQTSETEKKEAPQKQETETGESAPERESAEAEVTADDALLSVTAIRRGDYSDITDEFNYAYGVRNMNDLKRSGVSIIFDYFALGMYHASLDWSRPVLVSLLDIQDTINRYRKEYLDKGISFDKGRRPETIEELLSLPVRDDLPALFSYAYGFSIVRDLRAGDIDIRIIPFISGMADALYQDFSPLSDSEIEDTLERYILYLNEEYYQKIEETALSNRERSRLFLEKNGNSGVTVLPDGVQIMVLDRDETTGRMPSQYDTVLLDYNEYVLDYDTEELFFTDAGWGVEISLFDAKPGFRSAVTGMHTGEAVRAFIPPELTGITDGTEDIEPWSVIVYDIALHSIL